MEWFLGNNLRFMEKLLSIEKKRERDLFKVFCSIVLKILRNYRWLIGVFRGLGFIGSYEREDLII